MTVHERLELVFREVFDDEELVLQEHTASGDVQGWDSVAHINLMFAIEEEFGITFPGNKLAELRDIGELKQYLDSQGCR